MSALPFLRAVRPVRALIITVFYTAIAWLQLRHVLKLPVSQQAVCTAGLILPFFWTSLIAGGLHGVMHRTGFPLLPDAIRRARLLYLRLAAAGVCACLLVSLGLSPDTPLAAIAGVAILVSAIPLLNTRRRPFYRGLLNPWFPVCFTVLGVLVFALPARLESLLVAAPWLVLALGLGLAALVLRHAFDRERVRARQEVLFASIVGTMSLNPQRMVSNGQFYSRELVRTREVTVKAPDLRLHSLGELCELAFWTERLQLGRLGGAGKTPKSGLHQLILINLGTLLPLALLVLLLGLFLKNFSPQVVAGLIVAWTRNESIQGPGDVQVLRDLSGFVLTIVPFLTPLVCYPILRLRLRVWMPVSRRLQARAIFRHALRLVLFYQPMALLPMAIPGACALWLDIPLGFWVAEKTLGIALLTLPLAPLVLWSSFLRSQALRTLIPASALLGAIFLAVIMPRLAGTLLGPLPILALLGATAAAFILLKRTIDARYLRGDLDGEMSALV